MDRYDRHRNLLPGAGHEKLRGAKALVAGAGGLGSTVTQLLTRFGIGEIHIYDNGTLDTPDLNRQTLYNIEDIGSPKAQRAAEKLKIINPDVKVIPYISTIEPGLQLPEVDIAMDCLDNFRGRLVLEELLRERGTPIVHGGIYQYFGQVTVIIPGQTACFTEMFGPDIVAVDDEKCKDIYPPAVTSVASIQVSEAIKLICGFGDLLTNRILSVDLLTNSFDIIPCHPL